MVVAKDTDSPSNIIATKGALLETDPDTIGAVLYKPLVDRNTQTSRQKDVGVRDDKKRKLD